MTSLAAWVLFPLVMWAVCAGIGLLAGAILRAPVPAPLVAPVGCFVAVVASLPVYKLGGTAPVAAALLVVLAVAGFVVARAQLRERLLGGKALLAGPAAYCLFIAPAALSGHWTWLGYNLVNDTAVNMVMTDHIAHHGVRLASGPISTTTTLINGTLASHYPMGIHSLLASLNGLLGFLPLEAVYQPFIAGLAGFAALSFAGLATRLGAPQLLAAALGAVAAGANLTYGYAAHGAFKEVALVAVLATSAGLCRQILDERMRLGAVAQLGVVFAAGIVIFSTAAGAYAAVFALVLVVAALLAPWRLRLGTLARAAAVGAAALVLAALPGLGDALAFGKTASTYYAAAGGLSGPNSTAFLGHLLRPLPLQEGIGIWPDSDYRVPLLGGRAVVTAALTVVVVALILFAAFAEVRRRRLGAMIVLVPGLAVYLLAKPRLGPYAEAKLLVILSPAVVFAAGLGAWYLGRRLLVAGAIAGAAVAGGVLVSDALAYHGVRIAPIARLQALTQAADHAPPRTPILAPEWEEWAKYFARDRQINTGPESFSPAPVQLRHYFSYFGHSVDLDLLLLPYVEEFPEVLVRRGPDASRPPANYRLAFRNGWYELWTRGPRPVVREHLSLQATERAATVPACRDVRALARRAAHRGQVLVASPGPGTVLFDYTRIPPRGWNPDAIPGTVVPQTPGRASGPITLAGGGYRVWVRGTSGRPLAVEVDNRRVGAAVGVDTPEQWLPAGQVRVSAGRHVVALVRGGGTLAPGNGFAAEIGPVAFEPLRTPRLLTVAPRSAARTLCGRRWDWIERVSP